MGLELFLHSPDGYLKWLYISLIQSCSEHTCRDLCISLSGHSEMGCWVKGYGYFQCLIHTAKLPFKSTMPIFTPISSASSHFLTLTFKLFTSLIDEKKKKVTHVCLICTLPVTREAEHLFMFIDPSSANCL